MPNLVPEKWINEIDLKYDSLSESIKYYIGSTFDKIFYDDSTSFSLKDFFSKIEIFFKKQMHMIYQADEPANKKIMEWYKVELDTEENQRTDDERTAAANNDEASVDNNGN